MIFYLDFIKMKKNEKIQEVIDMEESDLGIAKKNLESLETKWIKFSIHYQLIDFLKFYITKKEKLINELKNETKKIP